jgi:hypothetical protein
VTPTCYNPHVVVDLAGYSSWQEAELWLQGWLEAHAIGRDPGRPPVEAFILSPWPRVLAIPAGIEATFAHEGTKAAHLVRYRSTKSYPIEVVCDRCGKVGELLTDADEGKPLGWTDDGVQVPHNESMDLTHTWHIARRDVRWFD